MIFLIPDLFRGYVPLAEGKTPKMRYANRELLTLSEVRGNYGGVMKKGFIMIDIDEPDKADILLKIVQENCTCHIQKTTRGYHFYFLNTDISKNKQKVKTAIGITVEHKVNENTLVPIVVDGHFREWIQIVDEPELIPLWLRHVTVDEDFFKLQPGSRNESLFKYQSALLRQGFDGESVIKTINIINKFILQHPLPQKEVDAILRDVNEERERTFFIKKQFFHNLFGDFLMNNETIALINGTLHILTNENLYSSEDADFEKIMIKRLPIIKSSQRTETLKYLKYSCNKQLELSNERYIPLKDKVYDLKTGDMLDYNRRFVFKNKLDFMPFGYSRTVDDTLDKVCCNDKNLRLLLEEMVGYCLFRRNELRKCFILTGEKQSGKSSVLKMIIKLIGRRNVSTLSLKDLAHNFRPAQLDGKLVNIGDDIDDKFVDDDSMFKKLVSGENVTLEKKGKDPYEYQSTVKFIFSANKLPRINDKGDGFLSRVIVVPFNAVFSDKDADFDPFIIDKLCTEEALGYLLKLALDGLKRVYVNNSFTKVESVEKELESYSKLNNPILLFLEEEPKVENELTKDVYRKYMLWCIENGYKPLSNIVFGREVCKKLSYSTEKKIRINGKEYRMYTSKVKASQKSQ